MAKGPTIPKIDELIKKYSERRTQDIENIMGLFFTNQRMA